MDPYKNRQRLIDSMMQRGMKVDPYESPARMYMRLVQPYPVYEEPAPAPFAWEDFQKGEILREPWLPTEEVTRRWNFFKKARLRKDDLEVEAELAGECEASLMQSGYKVILRDQTSVFYRRSA